MFLAIWSVFLLFVFFGLFALPRFTLHYHDRDDGDIDAGGDDDADDDHHHHHDDGDDDQDHHHGIPAQTVLLTRHW